MKKKVEEPPMPNLAYGALIDLAIIRGRNRLVIPDSFDLYHEFMQASFPIARSKGNAQSSDAS